MLRIKILAVGKLKETYLRDAIEEYLKRVRRFADVSVFEMPEVQAKSKSTADLDSAKTAEGKSLLAKASGFCVALDQNGTHLTSEKFSEFITGKTQVVSEITFFIGGSDGLSEEVLKSADARLSFSKLTFPHRLMRVIFAEQLYRAFMIAEGLTYHK